MSVRSVTFAVAVAVLSASTAFAQGWHEYISRDEFFLVGMPSEPQITSTTYRAASGAMLPAVGTITEVAWTNRMCGSTWTWPTRRVVRECGPWRAGAPRR
jgi:hypothetical protein